MLSSNKLEIVVKGVCLYNIVYLVMNKDLCMPRKRIRGEPINFFFISGM